MSHVVAAVEHCLEGSASNYSYAMSLYSAEIALKACCEDRHAKLIGQALDLVED